MPKNSIPIFPIHSFVSHRGTRKAMCPTAVAENRIMDELTLKIWTARVKDLLNCGEMNTLSWDSGEKMLADSLTKKTGIVISHKLLKLFQ